MLTVTSKTPLTQPPSALHEALLQTEYPFLNSVFALSGILSVILLYRGVDLALDYFFPDDTPSKIGVVFSLFALSALLSYTVGAFLLNYHTFKTRGGGSWTNFFFRRRAGAAVAAAASSANSDQSQPSTVVDTEAAFHVTQARGSGAPPRQGSSATPSRGSSRRQHAHQQPRLSPRVLQTRSYIHSLTGHS